MGRKRRFLTYGIINVGITNLLLQFLLFLHLATGVATFLSQILNVCLGYLLYGARVFKVARLGGRSAASYSLLAVFLWLSNWWGIQALATLGCPRGVGALILVPLLAAFSYFIQKTLVFRPANP